MSPCTRMGSATDPESFTPYRAKLDARLRERATEQLLRLDHAVLRIEEYAEEAFVPEVLHAKAKVAAHRGGRCEAVSRFHLLRERAARDLHHGRDLRRAERT